MPYMKKLLFALAIVLSCFASSCKGDKSKEANSADSGQTHVNSAQPGDSSKYPVSPVETGGQDTSSSAVDPAKPADTVKTKP